MGGDTEDPISAIEVAGDYVFVAAGKQILGYHRGKLVRSPIYTVNLGASYAGVEKSSDSATPSIDNDASSNCFSTTTPCFPYTPGGINGIIGFGRWR